MSSEDTSVNALPLTYAALRCDASAGRHIGAQVYVSLSTETIADFAYGEARPGISMTTDTLMLWLSACKPITAVAVGLLLEDGCIELDAPVSRYIPEFGKEGKEQITIEHILMHTGGFRGGDKVSVDLEWREIISGICSASLESDWTPGNKAGYHISSGWFILGELVQRLTNTTFPEFVRNRIFLPLGMMDSWIGMPPERYKSYGTRIGLMHHTTTKSPRPFEDPEKTCTQCRPSGGGYGPIRELGKFYKTLLNILQSNNTGILNRETTRLLTSRRRQGMFDHTFKHVMDWGLGFMINSNRYGAETVPYGFGVHAAEDAFGHGGAQSSCGFADPAHNLVVAWVLNGMCGEKLHQARVRKINSAIYEDLGLA
ncbi:MAG: beta-lactamase family protein [Verrucomicrobia bacterium]|nr:beta-lactamase family protein [Verrucomicrobiota bacterium]